MMSKCKVGSETDEELAKRMRYYQSQMDADHLARGKDYVELKKTIIIFICPFDPYKRGWHLYGVRKHLPTRCGVETWR